MNNLLHKKEERKKKELPFPIHASFKWQLIFSFFFFGNYYGYSYYVCVCMYGCNEEFSLTRQQAIDKKKIKFRQSRNTDGRNFCKISRKNLFKRNNSN